MSRTLHSDLSAHISAFVRRMEHAGRRFSELERCTVLAGVYDRNTERRAFTRFGQALTPTYVLRVASQPVRTQVADRVVSFDLSAVNPEQHALDAVVYLESRGDAVSDDAATLVELLQVYDAEGENGTAWAQAIAGAADRQTRFAQALSSISEAPPGSPAGGVGQLVDLLALHFTYDAQGAYYPKWTGAGREVPGGLSPAYLRHALRERVLQAGEIYCYGVVPCGDAGPNGTPMQEFLVHIDRVESGQDPFVVAVVHLAARPAVAQPFHHFCFFHAAEGSNIAIPPAARTALMPELADLLGHHEAGTLANVVQHDPQFLVDPGAADGSVLRVLAVVKEGATLQGLPPGVTALPRRDAAATGQGTAGEVIDGLPPARLRRFRCPVSQLLALAEHADVEMLVQESESLVSNDEVRSAGGINLAGLLSDLSVTAGGQGVLVGIVDSGIDGAHPAFAGRIYKMWDMSKPVNASFPAPDDFPYGQVYSTAADIAANAVDLHGHGTHVAGTAAGAAGGAYTQAGIATRAQLIVANPLKPGAPNSVLDAVQWMLAEADDADKPIVINMSLTNMGRHGRDGTDLFSLSLRDTIRTWYPLVGNTWDDGKILVAASGNQRANRGHAHVDSLAFAQIASFEVVVRANTAVNDWVDFWARPIPADVTGCSAAVQVSGSDGAGTTPWRVPRTSNVSMSSPMGTGTVRIANGPLEPHTQHRRMQVFLQIPAQATARTYTVRIMNLSHVAIEVHGYIQDAFVNGPTSGTFFRNATERCMIGAPAAANGIIAVGATVNRTSWVRDGTEPVAARTVPNDNFVLDANNQWAGSSPSTRGVPAQFSNCGPVRGARRTVDVMAPGDGILSARSKDATTGVNDRIDALTRQMSGTSMASPVVTGVIACMLGHDEDLDYEDIVVKLRFAVKTPPAGWDAMTDGRGPLDASKIMD